MTSDRALTAKLDRLTELIDRYTFATERQLELRIDAQVK
jgi:hypothetical protein